MVIKRGLLGLGFGGIVREREREREIGGEGFSESERGWWLGA